MCLEASIHWRSLHEKKRARRDGCESEQARARAARARMGGRDGWIRTQMPSEKNDLARPETCPLFQSKASIQSGCPTGNGKKLSSSQAQLGQATYLDVA